MVHSYNISRLLVVISTLLFLSLVGLANAEVRAIIVFGDSTVDTGNNNAVSTVMKANFPPYGRDFPDGKATGRFSNGRLTPDFISEAYGLKPTIPAYLDPAYNITDFATGVCFASAGTGMDNATSDVLNTIPMWKEVEYYREYQERLRAYVGKDKAKDIITESLYFVSIGTNDWMENYYLKPHRRIQFTVQQYQDFLLDLTANFIRQIYNLGARKIVFTTLYPLGCLPLERTVNVQNHQECVDQYNDVSLEYNVKLENLTDGLNKELPGLRMVLDNHYDLLYQMIKNSSAFGFEVSDRGCCATGKYEMSYLCNKLNPFTCKDANKYVWWDSFHATERTYKIIADKLFKSVLQPAFSK